MTTTLQTSGVPSTVAGNTADTPAVADRLQAETTAVRLRIRWPGNPANIP